MRRIYFLPAALALCAAPSHASLVTGSAIFEITDLGQNVVANAGLGGRSVAGPVIDHADVGGLRTFQDVATGLIWVDLDNFFGLSTAEMQAIVEVAGFTFAARASVEELLFSLPMDGSGLDWDAYAAIMGRAPNRDLIWGSYDDGGDTDVIGSAWSFRGQTVWPIDDGFVGINDVPNSESPDMNIWAYHRSSAIPEPSSVVLLGIAGVGLVALRRFGRKV